MTPLGVVEAEKPLRGGTEPTACGQGACDGQQGCVCCSPDREPNLQPQRVSLTKQVGPAWGSGQSEGSRLGSRQTGSGNSLPRLRVAGLPAPPGRRC